MFLGRSAQIIAARSKSARALYPPTSANLTCPLSRRRSRGRERHRAIDDQREGRRPTLLKTLALARRLLAEDPGRPWRPWRRGLTPEIARSFGGDEPLVHQPPLALPENAGLSAPDSHLRRHRHGDATDHGARRPSARNRPSRSGPCPGCRAADVAVHFIENRFRVSQCGIGLRCSIAFTRESGAAQAVLTKTR